MKRLLAPTVFIVLLTSLLLGFLTLVPPAFAACPEGTSRYKSADACVNGCPGACVLEEGTGEDEPEAKCCFIPSQPEDPGVVTTPFGDIPTDPAEFGVWVLERGMGFGVLLALLFIVIGGFGVATSAGDPDRLQKAKSQITAAVSGLVFLLLAGLILNILGEQIIGIDFF